METIVNREYEEYSKWTITDEMNFSSVVKK